MKPLLLSLIYVGLDFRPSFSQNRHHDPENVLES